MRNITLLTLAPFAFASQAAQVLDYSETDISSALNIPHSAVHSVANRKLSYQDLNRVEIGKQVFVRKQQLHYGIPVYGHSIVADLSTQGFVQPIAGHVVTGIEEDIDSTLPMISAKQAIEIATGASQGYTVSTSQSNDAQADLLIWLDEQKNARLIYKVDALQIENHHPSRPITFVDAKSGEIVDKWEGIAFHQAEGPGGNQKSGRYYFGPNTKFGGFQVNHQCQMDSENVITLNMNNQEWGGQVHRFNCSINNYRAVNGAYAPMNDAHYFGQRVFNMYQEWIGARPIRQKLTMRVHYASNYGNAFWDGRQMTFGDGNSYMYPLATWDVIAHEVSHGFTEQNSGLEYRGMSGGMNESFSDVAAAALSQYVHGSFNWKMGEHVMKHSPAMRYFINPSHDGSSIEHINQYYNGIDVHHSSGIFNKAFYHLATSAGWDIKKAFIAYATANQLYWQPNSNFQQGAEGVCKAAQKLGYDSAAVASAFSQVGVQVVNCTESQPTPTPKPESGLTELKINEPSMVQPTADHQQPFVLRQSPSGKVWIQTYHGLGNVNMYVALNRQASLSDYDCMSSNEGNHEYCEFNNIKDADIYILVTNTQGASEAYVAVSAELETPQPKPVPQNHCDALSEWSPYHYYPAGTAVKYWGNRFISMHDNWGENPYSNYWVWAFEGSC
ncbi:M4 family metallopeptidase [Vibrio cholerae]|uniref:M4 family metallopeptidase n=1 Tax=Vibrio cholerae TaxID=666 RepID=UPI001E2E9E6B|nr:M4 family metallopeptidase [Vibrio cholerae]MCD1196811.1 hemagglutinin [Vibrio cholerae]MCD1199046.1 hemagglutinin [Vibrio cholerae]MCD1208286.1 hemagglutinin [Vibrio cholerae]MCD1215973.1 hemagglutinin [Vibrio cholerae]MCD1224945.1 hemagglutinin [Vibrio cholerae]